MTTSVDAEEKVHTGDVNALSARGLWRCFPHKKAYSTVLENIDLDIAQGEFVAILGPSGCGKSTLLALLAGLDKPTVGEIHAHGREVQGPVRDAGFVFQRDLLLDWRTVLDNVLLPLQLRGERTSQYRDRAMELLTTVGLDTHARHFPWQLSGGMRQRISICRALIGDPDILFMDEPFGALDALTRERLNDDLLRICSAGVQKTVVFVTHDVAESAFLGDRVVVMGASPGRIFADIRVELPGPRTAAVRDTTEFTQLNSRLRSALRDEEILRTHGQAGTS